MCSGSYSYKTGQGHDITDDWGSPHKIYSYVSYGFTFKAGYINPVCNKRYTDLDGLVTDGTGNNGYDYMNSDGNDIEEDTSYVIKLDTVTVKDWNQDFHSDNDTPVEYNYGIYTVHLGTEPLVPVASGVLQT